MIKRSLNYEVKCKNSELRLPTFNLFQMRIPLSSFFLTFPVDFAVNSRLSNKELIISSLQK